MKPLQRFEWLLPVVAGLCLLISTLIVSPHQPMWLDEVYTYYALAHDSFGAFCRSYATNVNATPPLYFAATWAVSTVIPLSPLSLRLYSSLASGVALVFLWATLRRHTGFFVSSAATLTACLTSDLFLTHSAEARFYGLYFALVAWEIYNYDRICANVAPSSRRLVGNGLSHGLALSCTHVAGFYSVATFVSLLISDRALRVWRPKVYLSVLAGWLPALFYAPLLWAQRGATSWMRRPGPTAIFNPFDPGLHAYFILCAFAGLVAVALLGKHYSGCSSGAAAGNRAETKRSLHLVILALTFLAVPYGLLFVSWAGMPLLLDRYALPSLIGIALLSGLVCSGLFGDWFETSVEGDSKPKGAAPLAASFLRATLLAAMLAYPIGWAIGVARSAMVMQSATQARATENEIVLATSDPKSYFPRYFQSGESHRIYWVVRDSKARESWERFNKRLNPITIDDFLAAHEHFQISSEDVAREWLEGELRRRGGFRITSEERSEKGKVLTVVAQSSLP